MEVFHNDKYTVIIIPNEDLAELEPTKEVKPQPKKTDDKLENFIKSVLAEAGFSTSNTNIREAKPSAKKALADHIPIDDIMKAAKGIRQYEGDIRPTVRSAFQSTSFWMSQVQPEKPKGVWNG
jgi:hypothetical protein